MRFEDRSIDDIHLAAVAEYEHDEITVTRLQAAYVDARLRYIAELALIEAERNCEEER